MKKLLLFLSLFVVAGLNAQNVVHTVINEGSTGTTSATVIIEPASSPANITDLMTRVDSGNTSATVDIRPGRARSVVSSATVTSLTQLWFDNDPTQVASQDFVIFHDVSLGTFTLLKAAASTATSITTYETISVATTTSDFVYTLEARIRRPVANVSSTSGLANIWLPANVPSALTLDGNTTSCQIEVSGVRSDTR